MKIQNRNGIHFLEKTSYCENHQTKPLMHHLLWRVATALLVTSLIISTYALLFEGVFFSYSPDLYDPHAHLHQQRHNHHQRGNDEPVQHGTLVRERKQSIQD